MAPPVWVTPVREIGAASSAVTFRADPVYDFASEAGGAAAAAT
jgi:hypothetical protein